MSKVTKYPAHDSLYDDLTGVPRNLTEVRHMLHEGNVFAASETFITLTDAVNYDVLLRTPADPQLSPHILALLGLVRKNDCFMSVYSNPTFNEDILLDATTGINLNFQSSKVPTTKVWNRPEIITLGTELVYIPLPDKYAAIESPELEGILTPSTDFLIRIYMHKAGIMRFVLKWYEHQSVFDDITTY